MTASRWRRRLGLDRRGLIATALIAVPVAAYATPSLGFWGWHGRIGQFDVYGDTPATPALRADLARAERLLAASPIDDPRVRPTLYLTDGGWRWRFYTLDSGAFALTRPWSASTIFYRADPAMDRMERGDRRRTLSGVVAHETVHVLEAHRVGLLAYTRMPLWVREGYADHVARESSLDDASVERLRAEGKGDDPAIAYREARLKVEAALDRGVGVDELLSGKGM